MPRPVTLPDSLCAFIRSLDKPPVFTLPARSTTEPETDNASDTTAPPAYPPPRHGWRRVMPISATSWPVSDA
ncbi:hypothetical protein E3N42_04405 [Salmonella enterica]|nr:hypothetical protein [Salmonella enterica]